MYYSTVIDMYYLNNFRVIDLSNEFYFYFESRGSNDMYEFNSEEVNIEKIVGDIVPAEEKRSHSRAGCDCQLSVRTILVFFFLNKKHLKISINLWTEYD